MPIIGHCRKRSLFFLCSPGNVALDVGANIGYFTLLLSRLVGDDGRVVAFEPTEHYGNLLRRNLAENGVSNCHVEACGLSSEEGEYLASIGDSSATLHWVSPDQEPRLRETIRLVRLDDIVETLEIDRIDFVKVDVDGHEPLFFEGAWQTLERFKPIILMEVSAPHYLHGGTSAADFYDTLVGRGLHVYSEMNLEEYPSKVEFLSECGKTEVSANVIVSFSPLKGLG
jgi:FkbM family methyltransferase